MPSVGFFHVKQDGNVDAVSSSVAAVLTAGNDNKTNDLESDRIAQKMLAVKSEALFSVTQNGVLISASQEEAFKLSHALYGGYSQSNNRQAPNDGMVTAFTQAAIAAKTPCLQNANIKGMHRVASYEPIAA